MGNGVPGLLGACNHRRQVLRRVRHATNGAAAATTPGPTSVAERRVCSVLFCDLVGFTPLSESRDAEEVRELLSRYFDTARTVITRYGGTIEKFIGDAVMAVWGTPVAVEGDTERAVRAGLELLDAVETLGAEIHAPGLRGRAGIVTGEVAVTMGATNEGMVAGDAVNTAARVQSAAEPGTVLVDSATRRLTEAAVEFYDAGEHHLKGKTEPQHLWRAGRVLSGIGGSQRVDGLEAPMTGRDAELRMVKDLFHAAVDRRQPRLVAVSGPAGVGKSRLGWEFEKYIDGLVVPVWWHRGRCLSYGDGVSFWALAEMVRQRMDIAEEDGADIATAKLCTAIDTFVSDPAERAYIGVRLGRLLGLSYPGDARHEIARDELFVGWRIWLERLARVEPVALLIEDLHHADVGLLDFLDHLLDWARGVPIFVITFARPDLEQERPGWGTGRNRTFLALEPLDVDSMSSLLGALVPGMPAAAAAAIAEHARGIPLFAVETIRSLIDRDVVIPVEGAYRMVGDVGTLTVPDSLHGLLAARLDSLDPGVRSLVADAAVLGSSFPTEALIAVTGRTESEVTVALADLVHREVFEIAADPLSPQRGTHHFAHEMLRQVAYQTLSRRDRKQRHLAVAAHLRSTLPRDGDEVVDVIARHYLDALAAVPDDSDVDEIREQAVAALTRAGERARRTGAPRRARESFASAAELVTASNRSDAALAAARLWERAAKTAQVDAAWADAVDHADRAQRDYLAAGEPRKAAATQSIAGQALRAGGHHAAARMRLVPALETLRTDPDLDTVVVLAELAALEVFTGVPAAGQLTDEALALGQALDVAPDVFASLLITRGVWLTIVGRRPESVAYLRQAAVVAEQAGNTDLQGRALLNLCDALTSADPSAAASAARSAVDMLRRTGERYRLPVAISNLVVALIESGDWDAAEQTLKHSDAEDHLADDDVLHLVRVQFAGLRGRTEECERELSAINDLLASEAPQDRAALRLCKAVAAYARGDTAEALDHARPTGDLIDELGPGGEQIRWMWPLAARAAHDLGDTTTIAALLGQLAPYRPGELGPMLRAEVALVKARLDPTGTQFASAITGLRERSTPYHLAHGLLDHAEALIGTGASGDAAPLIDEARTIAEHLGAEPLARRATSLAIGAGVTAG